MSLISGFLGSPDATSPAYSGMGFVMGCWGCSEWEVSDAEKGMHIGKRFTCALGLEWHFVIFNAAQSENTPKVMGEISLFMQ